MYIQLFYNEGFTPQSGIDTIAIWIKPEIIKRHQSFHEKGNNNEYINLRYKRETAGNLIIRTNYFLEIQAEAINPNRDIYLQILILLQQLTENEVLCIPKDQDNYRLIVFYHTNFNKLFSLDKLDFYFDLNREDINLIGKPNPNYPNTRYSSCNPSILKAYFRDDRLREKRHISYNDIDNIEHPARIEFSLCRENCDYLNSQNLKGTYDSVFLRYLPFLARRWYEHCDEVVEVAFNKINYAHYLRQIIILAVQQTQKYTNLMKSPPKPISYKGARRNEENEDILLRYYNQ